jgi:hypothetical protein
MEQIVVRNKAEKFKTISWNILQEWEQGDDIAIAVCLTNLKSNFVIDSLIYG